MRSATVETQKTPGVFRLMLVGDSVTYVDHPHRPTERSSPRFWPLNCPPRSYSVRSRCWNALGRGLGAVANELGFLNPAAEHFPSDVVLFVLNTGDLVQEENHLKLTVAGGLPRPPPSSAIYELWARYLARRVSCTKAVTGCRINRFKPSPDVARLTPQVLGQLSSAMRIVARSGASFGIVYSPASGAQWQTPHFHAQGFPPCSKSGADKNRVRLIDLSTPYASAPVGEVYQDGIHLRERGNRLAADAIERDWPWPAKSR